MPTLHIGSGVLMVQPFWTNLLYRSVIISEFFVSKCSVFSFLKEVFIDTFLTPCSIGLKQPRLEGEEYYELMDEFMAAIKLRWPRALIQHEDFQSKYAVNLLKRLVIN